MPIRLLRFPLFQLRGALPVTTPTHPLKSRVSTSRETQLLLLSSSAEMERGVVLLQLSVTTPVKKQRELDQTSKYRYRSQSGDLNPLFLLEPTCPFYHPLLPFLQNVRLCTNPGRTGSASVLTVTASTSAWYDLLPTKDITYQCPHCPATVGCK